MNTAYDLGPFRLDTRAQILTRSGVPEALGARAVAVLAVLVENANETVLKSALMDRAWPGLIVEDSNLTVQISAIRRVLRQVTGGARWIETLARRGYRFVGPVSTLSASTIDAIEDDTTRSSLPQQVTSFVGRDRESSELAALLPAHRMVTLVGAGGIGKTRLALKVASGMKQSYRDGAWLVDVAPITDPDLVASTVAQVLHLRESGGKPLLETLCGHLRHRKLLLLLDNCEHVLAAAAVLAEALLKSAAGLTILATSREPLHIGGEQIYPLPPLSLPEPTADPETIARSDAVLLFVARARQRLPRFELTPDNSASVATLCIHLDGIPLALELAAARVPVLSIEQISARLDDRFRLLTGRTSNVLPRQQTLRATLDWSFDLLTDHERVVLRRLGIFAGGFTLEAAASVCAGDAIESSAVIDLLSQLVDRSLVVANTAIAGTRYRLLETTRAYALEKLAEAHETAAVRRRHALYLRDLFDGVAYESRRSPDSRWRDLYLPERDNVRAALDWAFGDGGEPELAVALAGGSGGIWAELSLQSEGRHRLEAAIATMTDDTPIAERARLWLWLAMLWGTAKPARAVEASESAIALYRQLGDDLLLGESLAWLARIWVFMGRFEQAAPVFADALALLERVGMAKPIGSCLEGDGFRKMLTGDISGARENFERALAQFRTAGATLSVLGVLVNLGDLSWALGDLDAALAQCREAVRLMQSAPHLAKEMLGTCLTNLAGVLTERGELAEALAVAREGLPLRRDSGHAWVAMDSLALRAALAGKLDNAARIAGYADATHAAKESLRQPNEARAYARLMVVLRNRLAADDIERLMTAGAALDEDEACRIALEG